MSDSALAEAFALARAVLESATGGVIVTALDGRVITFNQRFTELWRLAESWQRQPIEGRLPQFADQTQDGAAFIARIYALLAESDQEAYDMVAMADGRILERYSRPFRVGERVAGRLWSYRDISERVALERAMQRRDTLLEAISAGAEHFLDISDLDRHLPTLLARLGGAAVVSRICLFENVPAGDDTLLMSLRYEWCAPGCSSRLHNPALQRLPYHAGGFARWETVLRQGQIIYGSVSTFPPSERLMLEAQQIRSLLVIPIWVGAHWWGFMGFNDCIQDRVWLTEEIDTLKIAARMIGAAMRRQNIETELLLLNTTLEQQVQQRTAELKHAYQRLEQSLADRTAAYQHLADSDARRRALLEAMPDSMILFRTTGKVLEWQAGGRDLPYPLGNQPEPSGQADRDSPQALARFQAAIEQVTATGAIQIFEYTMQFQGAARWFEARLVPVDDDRVLALIREITERKESEAQLQQLALHDVLTGLPNRALLYDRMQQALRRATRDPTQPFGLLLLDIDDFKRINDGLGHGVGDDLLVAMARRLRGCLRAVDTVARLGGDEFAILLDAPQNRTSLKRAIERLQQAVASPFNLGERPVMVGVSIGVVVYADWHRQAEDVLRDADIALYRAKEHGKGQYALFDATMHAQVIAQVVLEADLRKAIQQAELQVYYQPVMHLPSGQIHGFEALVRWQHPTRGLLAPADFLPLASKIGLDVAIDRWVFHEACRQLQTWQQYARQQPLTISVNLSTKHLEHPDLIAYVAQVLQSTGVRPDQIMLEVTESSLIGDVTNALIALTQLRQLGLRIGLDDFGTGYSSLSYLHRFPVDVLKIDRAFLRELDPQGRNQVILQALVQLAQTLGLEVIAEGAETAAHVAQLRALNCSYVQGFYVAQPLDREAAEAYLR